MVGDIAVASVGCGVGPVGGFGAFAESPAFVSTGVTDAGVIEGSVSADFTGVHVRGSLLLA